jgi:hypothetical protein
MKKIIFYSSLYLLLTNLVNGQSIPTFIQQKLHKIKSETEASLNNYRFITEWKIPYKLSHEFSDEEILLIDSLNLDINTGMIYDDKMRDRIVQLLRNEYLEDEIDTLVNRQMTGNFSMYENDAMKACKFDTMQLFKTTLDSFYLYLKNQNMAQFSISMYKYNVFKLLRLDTTTIFRQVYNKIIAIDRERVREEWLTKTYYDHTYIAMLCGYINDKRFIKPLIEALDKPDNFQKEKVLESLVRMRVEPYYSEYVKLRIRTIEQIKKESPDFDIDELAYVIRTQESFLELSKYLLSNCPYSWMSSESGYIPIPVKVEAFDLIRINIKNKELKKLINNKNVQDNPEIIISTYDWMQKNYGKYEIKRLW